ncbi:uncharacterized protein BXZ73DRAFT_74882 [Epithele typhae]|uniref:uncharacterized protein n=1 Tax=Epithele typhae TaxID=378194 RepID=UPI0020082C47|nr:uncharacterized protein BXZ73DRAFT_74882 [Epithele typhae]KAH9941683.1 hypothetical protein BXZ73DRAFT_74882 [Epithele typhae]
MAVHDAYHDSIRRPLLSGSVFMRKSPSSVEANSPALPEAFRNALVLGRRHTERSLHASTLLRSPGFDLKHLFDVWAVKLGSLSVRSRTRASLQSKWAVVGAVAVFYDYVLTLDSEIKYIWRRKVTSASMIYIVIRYSSLVSNVLTFLNFFPSPGKSSPMCNAITLWYSLLGTAMLMSGAVFSSLRAHALCQCKPLSFCILVLGSGNAVPSVYAAIKTQATYNPVPNNILTNCDIRISQFLSFRKGTAQQRLKITTAFFQNGVAYFAALLVVNIMNLAFINNVQLLFNLIGALTAMTVVLTCRFILDLFEASTRGRFGTVPTLHLSTGRSLAFRRPGGLGATGTPQGIFGADVSWDSTEESESDWSKKDDYGFELQPVNPARQTDAHPFR